MKTVSKWMAILLCVLMLGGGLVASAEDPSLIAEERKNIGMVADDSLNLNCKSAVLMEAETGSVIYAQNPNESLPPASVTKIMTLLLVMEAIDSGSVHLEDMVSISANAASMGGSQVFLKEGEQMCVEDLLKSVVIASANDAAVALAEYICGSVNTFVERMNTKAKLLGMKDTVFENVTGLDDTAEHHLTSAMDIALMSKELISHKTILQYSTIWMDTIRDGAFGLTNTNRLVRFYKGCTGLKTGSTSKAGFCVSVTAERNDFSLICVIMGAESRDIRNAAAAELLDWGFANYTLFRHEKMQMPPVPVIGGVRDTCSVSYPAFAAVVPKGSLSSIETKIEMAEQLTAPVAFGKEVGRITFLVNGKTVGERMICTDESVDRINFFQIFQRMFAKFLLI